MGKNTHNKETHIFNLAREKFYLVINQLLPGLPIHLQTIENEEKTDEWLLTTEKLMEHVERKIQQMKEILVQEIMKNPFDPQQAFIKLYGVAIDIDILLLDLGYRNASSPEITGLIKTAEVIVTEFAPKGNRIASWLKEETEAQVNTVVDKVMYYLISQYRQKVFFNS